MLLARAATIIQMAGGRLRWASTTTTTRKMTTLVVGW